MKPTKRMSWTLIAALVTALVAIPSLAFAQPFGEGAPGPEVEEPAPYAKKGKRARRRGKRVRRFPMKAEKFLGLVAQRINKAEARLNEVLKRRNVKPELAAEIKADFQKGANVITGAAEKAAADGMVTKQEAQKVRQVARKVRQQARKKYRAKIRAARKGPKHPGGGPANL